MHAIKRFLAFVFVALVCAPALAQITFKGGAAGTVSSGATSRSVTYTPAGTGDIVVLVLAASGTLGTVTCTDSNSVSLTAGPATINGSQAVEIFYYRVPTSVPTSFSCSWTTSRAAVLLAGDYSGVASVNAAPTGDTNTGSSTTPTSSPTITKSNDWIVGGTSEANAPSSNTGNLRESNGATRNAALGDNTSATVGSVTFSVTQTTGAWATVGIELVQQSNAHAWMF
jgi:hypothetical protein